jgi:predicted N-formylglutamate amidohydrolase
MTSVLDKAVEGRNLIVAENEAGAGPFLLLCDHASNRIPEGYQSFGFAADQLELHIAWDPGALAVASLLSARLDSPLFWPDVSRLVIDCNRPLDAASLIVVESEGRPIPANRELSTAERARRIDHVHVPYHDAIDACLARRVAAGVVTVLIAVHSFTPTYLGKARPWQVGIVFDEEARMANALISGLTAEPALTVGVNEPYSPADLVYYTVSRHARPHGLLAAMIEIRNDEIADEAGQRAWADRLADILLDASSAWSGRPTCRGVNSAPSIGCEREGTWTGKWLASTKAGSLITFLPRTISTSVS